MVELAQVELKLRNICLRAIEKGSEEIYLLVSAPPFLRIDGDLQPLASAGILSETDLVQIKSLILGEKEKEFKDEYSLVYPLEKVGNVWVEIVKEKRGFSIYLKFLDRQIKEDFLNTLPKLVQNLAEQEKGVVFISGPHDSGKSTLAACLLDKINKEQTKFISTLEKPIKYRFESKKSLIEQREVGEHVSSFKQGLISLKEKNVDVCLITKLEDKESLDMIFEIAEMGTLVFVISYFCSSIGLIRHLLHFYSIEEQERARYFLSKNLAGIICTRLVPKIGGGRIMALEVLPATPAVQTIIKEGKLYQLHTFLQSESAISLERYLADLVISGKVLFEQGLKSAIDPDSLKRILSR